MAYDRYDPRRARDERSWRDDEFRGRAEHDERFSDRGRRDERGFFERAGDEISSWFGDERDPRRDRSHRERGFDPGPEREYRRDRDERGRGWFEEARSWFGGSDRDDRRGHERDRHRGGYAPADEGREFARERGFVTGRGHDDQHRRDYRPMTGDYGRFERRYGSEGPPRGSSDGRGSDFSRNRGEWDYDPPRDRERNERRSQGDRDDYRRTSFAGSGERGDRSRAPGFDDGRERGAMFGRDRDSGHGHRDRGFDDDRRSERGRRALNEDEGQRRDRGPHMLDRSFSGTYR